MATRKQHRLHPTIMSRVWSPELEPRVHEKILLVCHVMNARGAVSCIHKHRARDMIHHAEIRRSLLPTCVERYVVLPFSCASSVRFRQCGSSFAGDVTKAVHQARNGMWVAERNLQLTRASRPSFLTSESGAFTDLATSAIATRLAEICLRKCNKAHG